MSTRQSGPCFNMEIYQQVTIYCGKEEKLLLRSNFSSFPQYFQYISNFRSQITYSYMKCGCSIYFVFNFANLTCRCTDISKYFRESLGLLDNESRLYIDKQNGWSGLYCVLGPFLNCVTQLLSLDCQLRSNILTFGFKLRLNIKYNECYRI